MSLVGPGGLLTRSDEDGGRDRVGSRADRPPGLRAPRVGGTGQHPERYPDQDGQIEVSPVAPGAPAVATPPTTAKIVRERQRRLVGSTTWWCHWSRRASRPGRSRRARPRCTAARRPGKRSARSPIGSATAWSSGEDWPLDQIYPVVFIDAIMVNVRDGQVANRPIYTAVGVTVDGERDILAPVGRRRWVVEALDPLEDRRRELRASDPGPAVEQLSLHRRPERLHEAVVDA